jgi:glycosyltransferase involved in cell wall biosynthesis
MIGRYFIHAINIHQGGGRSLLWALLNTLDEKIDYVLSLDIRMPIPEKISGNIQIMRVYPTVLKRIMAERWLVKTVREEDIVLCFGNLPPLFRLRARTLVFLQNRYLVDRVSLMGLSKKNQIRLTFERFWLSFRLLNVDEFIVQTSTMKRLLEASIKNTISVQIFPFVAHAGGYTRSAIMTLPKNLPFDFVYVASGEIHKNHRKLIEAWCLLAQDGLFPSLCLTLDKKYFPGLCFSIEELAQQYNLKISNKGSLHHTEVLTLYRESFALIYPSKFESFGLPLIEARQAGLPILASELDYVRDVIDPEQVFDPESAISITRAVKRFMGIDEQPLPLLDATQFLASIIKKDV